MIPKFQMLECLGEIIVDQRRYSGRDRKKYDFFQARTLFNEFFKGTMEDEGPEGTEVRAMYSSDVFHGFRIT